MLELLSTVDGGVARTRTLLERGLSKHRIARAVAHGELIRIRRGWVAVSDADPQLVFAARHGLVLSCVTQARRLGIWARDRDPMHFAVPRPGAELRPPGATLHYHRPIIPREPFGLIDPVVNVLWLIARCQPHEDAVAAWDSAMNRRLVDRAMLECLALDGPAKRVLADADPFADSGLETYVRLRLQRYRLRVVWQPWIHGHHVDFLIGERLVLQIDGRDHVGEQRARDNQHDSLLRRRGYTVIRVDYHDVMYDWPRVQAEILEAIGQGLHLAR